MGTNYRNAGIYRGHVAYRPSGSPQTITHAGTAFGVFGSSTIRNASAFVSPSGFVAGALGTAAIYLKTRYVVPVGIDGFKGFGFGAGGSGFIDFGIRRRYPTGFDASLFGTAFLSGGVRNVDVPHFDATSFGTAFVAYKERFIEPSYFIGTRWGTAQVGYHQTVAPGGFDTSLFGPATEVFDNSKHVYPDGLLATEFGLDTFIAPRVRNVYPSGFWSRPPDQLPEERWGRPSVYNSRQYIQQYYEVTPDDGGVFGRWFDVENRNRTIQAYGWRTDKFPLTHLIELKAVALTPTGFVATQFGDTMIAYRIRTVTTIGEDTSLFTQWAQVRNTAQVSPLSGFDSLQVGTASVVNTRRYYGYIGAGDQGAFGTPFIAPRVRTIAPYYPYEGGEVKEPVVQLGTRFLRPVGIQPNEVGAATVEEHFNIIAPRWVHVDRMGEPIVHNVTPELHAYGHDSAAFGRAAVHNQFEYYAIQGFTASGFGSGTVVEYRTKQVAPAGIQAIRWGPNTRVRNDTPDPPGPQTLQAMGWDSAHVPGLANGTDLGVIVRGNTIYPTSLFPMTSYGVATVTRMGIGPAGGIYLLNQFGTASINCPQYVYQDGYNDFGEFGKPRLSPHTIWAGPATAQAIANHGGIEFHTVDFFPNLSNNRPFFGAATITNRNRLLAHYHGFRDGAPYDFTLGETFGNPAISNRRRWIYPSGKAMFKYGIPVLNGGGLVEATGEDSLQMGSPSIENYVDPLAPRYVRPAALDSFEYGQPVVSNFIRNLCPPSLDATVIGMARVHPPEPIVPVGFHADVYGNTFISNYIRYVEPVGIQPPDIDYVGGSFVDRMRVSERHTFLPSTLGDLLRMGAPMVSNKVRTIQPTDEIVGVVSAPTVTARSYVSVAAYGIDAGAFGDVQRWEADKIKVHGDDMLQPGYPRMVRTIAPASIIGAVGAPRIARPVAPSGPFTQVIGDLTISHGDNLDFVCGQLPRGIAVPGNSLGSFGTAIVLHEGESLFDLNLR